MTYLTVTRPTLGEARAEFAARLIRVLDETGRPLPPWRMRVEHAPGAVTVRAEAPT